MGRFSVLELPVEQENYQGYLQRSVLNGVVWCGVAKKPYQVVYGAPGGVVAFNDGIMRLA